jgi:hypothetical protein
VENLGDHRRVEPSADLGLEDLGQNHPDLTLAFTTAPTGAILDLAFHEELGATTIPLGLSFPVMCIFNGLPFGLSPFGRLQQTNDFCRL